MRKKYFTRYLQGEWIPGVTKEWILPSLFLFVFSFASQAATLNGTNGRESSPETSAVQQVVTGTVLDNQGLPLPGANIMEKGTSNGVMTDFDGNFSIEVGADAV